jgi:DNA ligase-1
MNTSMANIDDGDSPACAGIEDLAAVSAQVAAASSRLKKVALVSAYLRRLADNELRIALPFLCGELTQGKIGLGGAAVRQALSAAESSTQAEFTPLSLAEVDAQFDAIARLSGKGVNANRIDGLTRLFRQTSKQARYFLVRLVLGEMRQGAQEGILISALAEAMGLPVEAVHRATMFTGNLPKVAAVARAAGETGVRGISMELFRPVQPMLAQPADDVNDAMKALGEVVLEYKLDGVRVQVHKQGETVRIYTRHLNEVTDKVPELLGQVRRLPVEQMVLDGEILALRADGRPHPFQTTMTRFGRTQGIEAMQDSLPLSAWFFDCLLLDEQLLIDLPTSERYQVLAENLPGESLVPRLVTSDRQQAEHFFAAALAAGHEGIMAKALNAAYMAGSRGQSWLKIKRTHTLDLVILAAEWGSGRRRGWLSNLHLGARNPANGQFVMVGKTFKGLTDEMLTWQTARLLALQTARDDGTVYVKPALVVEITFNEVQQSPHYEGGFALRFARVKRYRDDKTPDQADTSDTIAQLFRHHRQ